MVNSKCFVILLLTIALSQGMPSPEDTKKDTKQDSLFGLPFLEFKNGGVRVNFAGYHAEAGLGGLLNRNGNGGGLYAGAGTPFGAHASAELGGALNGDKGGNAGGGLRARAGLGNGGPEASAGLGGNLDGADGAKNGGVLYTSRSNGGRTRIVTKNIGNPPSIDATLIPPTPVESNIQTIPRNKELSSNVQSDGLVRREITSPEEINVVEPLPVPPPVPAYAVANSRCRKKRRQICNRITKTIIQHQVPLAQVPADLVDPNLLPQPQITPLDARSSKIIAENSKADVALSPGPAPAASIPASAYGPARPRTLFDDIFNIPISTLHAVNQLLNSKVG